MNSKSLKRELLKCMDKVHSLTNNSKVYFKPMHNYIPLEYKRWIGMTFKEMVKEIEKG